MRRLRRRYFCSVLALFASTLVACWDNVATTFPPSLEPLETNTASFPSAQGGDTYPEKLETVTGEYEDSTYYVHAKGYVHRSIVDVAAAFRDERVGTDRREADEFARREVAEAPEGVDLCYVVSIVARSIITVEFDIKWRHGLVEGSDEAPEVVATRWQKTYGFELIEELAGFAALTAVDDNTTAFEMIYRLRAPRTSEEGLRIYAEDVYDDLVAASNGRALRQYD